MKNTKRNKIKKNKTLKTTKDNKNRIVAQILKEWKKQTNGSFVMDTETEFKYDYYLLFSNYDDYNNHIHLILNKFHYNNNINNNIFYMMKKYNKNTSRIRHSNKLKINIFSDPAKIVYNMIQNYNEFINT
jgi:hypothetical protein